MNTYSFLLTESELLEVVSTSMPVINVNKNRDARRIERKRGVLNQNKVNSAARTDLEDAGFRGKTSRIQSNPAAVDSLRGITQDNAQMLQRNATRSTFVNAPKSQNPITKPGFFSRLGSGLKTAYGKAQNATVNGISNGITKGSRLAGRAFGVAKKSVQDASESALQGVANGITKGSRLAGQVTGVVKGMAKRDASRNNLGLLNSAHQQQGQQTQGGTPSTNSGARVGRSIGDAAERGIRSAGSRFVNMNPVSAGMAGAGLFGLGNALFGKKYDQNGRPIGFFKRLVSGGLAGAAVGAGGNMAANAMRK